jgi:hypothetical protein
MLRALHPAAAMRLGAALPAIEFADGRLRLAELAGLSSAR